MKLRDYQIESVTAAMSHLVDGVGNGVVCIPTGGGKTHVLADICRRCNLSWDCRIGVIAHVKELLVQNYSKLEMYAQEMLRQHGESFSVGLYSAGLKRRDVGTQVLVGGIQSIYKRAREIGPFDLLIIDEAHLVTAEGDGMYRSFIAENEEINPGMKILGLTATPYRLDSGVVYGKDRMFDKLVYDVSISRLIDEGYLSPLISRAAISMVSTEGIRHRGGEFVPEEAERRMMEGDVVKKTVAEIIAQINYDQRRSTLIFCAGVSHAENIVEEFAKHGIECGLITGDTPTAERDKTIKRFQHNYLKFLANVNVLTTGFDATIVDCVALLRPTESPGLLVQMIGRGSRLHDGKKDCLVLDFAENILRHGCVDQITGPKTVRKNSGEGEAPVKICKQCRAYLPLSARICKYCNNVITGYKDKHDSQPSDLAVISKKKPMEWRPVVDVDYSLHRKKGHESSTPPTMRVDYHLDYSETVSEWICFEHTGYARSKAVMWWLARAKCAADAGVPESCEQAIDLAWEGGLKKTLRVLVAKEGKYNRIIQAEIEKDGLSLDLGDWECAKCGGTCPEKKPDDELVYCGDCGWFPGVAEERKKMLDPINIPF
jgi:DNA repair protein RadD